MTPDPAGNGRATIREVYELVEKVEGKIDAVDRKVVSLEEVCKQRPAVCALQRECVARTAAATHSEERWSAMLRYGWIAATVVAVVTSIIGWTH